MKLIVFAAVVGVCAAGALDHAYLPPNGNSGNSGAYQGNTGNAAAYQGNSGNYQAAHAPAQSSRPQAGFERNAAILKQDADVTADGFNYNFETENGIKAEESAHAENGVQAQGAFSYTGDDGQVYSIHYSADENGYQPQGAHLPVAPPTPEAILKALEQNARDEAAGIVDDGTYNAGKYGEAPAQQYGAPAQQYNAPAQKQQSGSFNPKSGYSY